MGGTVASGVEHRHMAAEPLPHRLELPAPHRRLDERFDVLWESLANLGQLALVAEVAEPGAPTTPAVLSDLRRLRHELRRTSRQLRRELRTAEALRSAVR